MFDPFELIFNHTRNKKKRLPMEEGGASDERYFIHHTKGAGKMEDKVQKAAELEAVIAQYDAQLKELEAAPSLDVPTYTITKSNRDAAQKQLDAINEELAAGSAAQADLSNQFDNIEVAPGKFVSLRVLTVNDSAYDLVTMFMQGYVGEMAQTNAALVASYRSENEKLKEDNAELESLRRQLIDVTDKLADMETKRDAAAAQIQELQDENKRLGDDNKALRTQIETAGKPITTNANVSAADVLKEWEASRPLVYNVGESNGKFRLATLLETGETVQWFDIYKGKYRIATEEEVAARFRDEQAGTTEPAEEVQADSSAEETVSNPPLAVEPPPSIPSETEDAEPGLDEANTDLEVAGEPVTRKEFEELTARVSRLEQMA